VRQFFWILSIGSLIASWTILVRLEVYRFALLPDPVHSFEWGFNFVRSWLFVTHTSYSAYRVWLAWLCACLLGIPLGLFIGWNRVFSLLTFPAVELLRPIPPIAWIPVAILFFPAVEPSVVFICFIGAFFPVVLNAKNGVEQINPDYFRAAVCLGAGRRRIFWDVVIPGALPSIVTGAAVGMGIAWMAVVAAEMIAGEFGLGYMIWDAYALARYPLIVVGMVIIGVLGSASSAIIRRLGSRLVRWPVPPGGTGAPRARGALSTVGHIFSPALVFRCCSPVMLVLAWYLLVSLPALHRVPRPETVLHAMLALDKGAFVTESARSLARVTFGFVLAALTGIPLGIVIGYSPVVRSLLFPVVEVLRPVPPIAWIPLSILFFVHVESQIIFLTFYGAFFPIIYNTITGVSGVDAHLIRASRSLGANGWQVFRRIVLPGSLPHVFTGLAVAMGITWLMVIAAEMIASRGGLGYFTWEAYTTFNYPLIVVGMTGIGVIGALSSALVRWIGHRMMPWRSRL
jgi:NitT/TauT family transport system permease protein